MREYRLLKYIIPFSALGTVTGAGFLLKDYFRGVKFKGEDRIAGKTVIITGANTGIGKETAKELAKRGGRIILACRDLQKCQRAKIAITNETYNRNVECKKCDLASIESISEFARTINAEEKRVDVLINNAGVMMCPKELTKDGFEMQLGVNHFGHFLLTNLLLDKLKQSTPSRIIIVSSVDHQKGEINFDDLNSSKAYDKEKAYYQSKLSNLLFQKELVKRLEGTSVTVNSLHPGTVNTEIFRHLPHANSRISRFFFFPITFFALKTPESGAQTVVKLAVDSELENVTGKYFSECEIDNPAASALDDYASKRLWAISEVWTRLKSV